MKKLTILITLITLASFAFAQSVEIKDSADETLMTINDEGEDKSSITIQNSLSAPSEPAGKLYNEGGTLKWSGTTLATGSSLWTLSGGNVYRSSGNVGIGTTSPVANLHVSGDDGLLVQGTYGNGTTQNLGAGTRMHFYPKKAAFRAGYVSETRWDDANIGDYSTALGNNTTASGSFSTAMGQFTTASGSASTAMGYYTTASGESSTAMGAYTTASGDYSTVMGRNTTASNSYSTAMGYETIAEGYVSTAMGFSTQAIGHSSTAMGGGTTASGYASTTMGYNTTASGTQSTAMGNSTTASGTASTAMGYLTTASGHSSTAMGGSTTASGPNSTAMGANTIASGYMSTAMGYYAKAEGFASVAIGMWNVGGGTAASWVATDPLFEIGIGPDVDNKANAVTVLKNGKVGIGTATPSGLLDVNGTIFQRGGTLHADYVFEDDYELESIQEHADFMWTNKHLSAIPKAKVDENGNEIVEVGAHRKGIVEELEKAHIYISQLEERITKLEKLFSVKN